jgi:hypothetical protein
MIKLSQVREIRRYVWVHPDEKALFDDKIVGLLGKFPVHGCLAAETVRPIIDAEHSTVALGDWTIHSGSFTKCVS